MKVDPELIDLVMNHPCNVVFRHNDSQKWECRHTGGTGGDAVIFKCALQLVQFEGYPRVLEYITAVKEVIPVYGNEMLTRFLSMGLG